MGSTKAVEESDKALDVARTKAIHEILAEEGFNGIELLSEVAESPHTVGWSLANATNDQYFDSIIPLKIGGQPNSRNFAGGFIWKRYWQDNWEWIDNALHQCIDERTAVNLLLALRFHPNVWARAVERGDCVRDTYWKECQAFNPQLELEAVSLAVNNLLVYSRPVDAIVVLSFAIHDKLHVASDLLCRSLEALLRLPKADSGRQIHQMDRYHIQEVIAELHLREDVATDRLILIEWHFIHLLDAHSQYSPKTLHKHLAHSPDFFHEVLSACSRSRNITEVEREAVTDHDKYMAEHAFHLLRDWNYIPGTQDDGSIDEQELNDWCLKAREFAIASGRIEVCDVQIGEMLSRCPRQDDDGSWPCQAIRRVIETIASDSIASGLHCGISNSRGLAWRWW